MLSGKENADAARHLKGKKTQDSILIVYLILQRDAHYAHHTHILYAFSSKLDGIKFLFVLFFFFGFEVSYYIYALIKR